MKALTDEQAFKAWLQFNDQPAFRQDEHNCVLAVYFRSNGIPVKKVSYRLSLEDMSLNWYYQVPSRQETFLPEWMGEIANYFDTGVEQGKATVVTADELREEFA